MSTFVVIECDAEDCDRQYDQGAGDRAEARRWAKQDGWGRFGNDDFCPDHLHLIAAAKRQERSTGLLGHR